MAAKLRSGRPIKVFLRQERKLVGGLERLLAFGLVLFQAGATLATTILIAWLGGKLAASWQRFPVKDDESGHKVRAGTMVALIAGTISVLSGVGVGAFVRKLCECGL